MISTTVKRQIAPHRIASIMIAVLGSAVMAGAVSAQTPRTSLHVVTTPSQSSRKPQGARHKTVISPYARAAAAHAGAGQLSAGHAPTMVQGMGRPRKARGGGGPK